MWRDLTHLSVAPWDLVIRGVVVYFAVILLLRISGKRQLGQMGATELVAILLISNAVQNSMNGGDNSLVGGLILASVLIFLSWFLSFVTFHSRVAQVFFEGTPRLLVHKGKLLEKNLAQERITRPELTVLLRKQGIHHLTEIHTAVLEADGTLSLIKVSDVG